MENLLTLNELGYHYSSGKQKKWVLKQLCYTFDEGIFYTITGASGVGKTTLLSIMAGIDTPNSGQILFNKQNINTLGLTKYRRKYSSVVFQAFNLIPYMSALENVYTALAIQNRKGISKTERAKQLLEEVGLEPKEMRRPVLSLSGGQQQRVAIARALSSDAPIIFADEPTGNLDQETSHHIISIFKRLAHEKNKCVIMVTHDMQIAAESDIHLRLKNGKLNP